MKVQELTGEALDYAVAMCEGLPIRKDPMKITGGYWIWPDMWPPKPDYMRIGFNYSPSSNWSQGGPIIERERLIAEPYGTSIWVASVVGVDFIYGKTLLEAAMKCYVCSKLGDEIDIPEDL